MLKLDGSGECFMSGDVESIMLVSENRIWNIGSDGFIQFWGPADYFDSTLDFWQTTNIDNVMDLHDIFDTLKRHAFLWPEYSYLLETEEDDELED